MRVAMSAVKSEIHKAVGNMQVQQPTFALGANSTKSGEFNLVGPATAEC